MNTKKKKKEIRLKINKILIMEQKNLIKKSLASDFG